MDRKYSTEPRFHPTSRPVNQCYNACCYSIARQHPGSVVWKDEGRLMSLGFWLGWWVCISCCCWVLNCDERRWWWSSNHAEVDVEFQSSGIFRAGFKGFSPGWCLIGTGVWDEIESEVCINLMYDLVFKSRETLNFFSFIYLTKFVLIFNILLFKSIEVMTRFKMFEKTF